MSTPERVDVTAIIARLAELLPKAFSVYERRRRPLAIGVRAAILDKVGDRITPDELNVALRTYTRNVGYQRAMAQPGAQRIDLEGNPVGAVTPEQAASAAKAVAAHWARQAARKAAARREACAAAGPVHTPMAVRPACETPSPAAASEAPAGPKRLGSPISGN
jgi:ProP effector